MNGLSIQLTPPRETLSKEHPVRSHHYTIDFASCGIGDIERVGGKNASLGEMFRELTPAGIKVPPGFAVTAQAYREFLSANGLELTIAENLRDLDVTDLHELRRVGARLRTAVQNANFPSELAAEIIAAYHRLCESGSPDVAVRSSATAEDLPTASFAGQQETYLNVHGAQAVLDACRRCFASLFTDRAIVYRATNGFNHLKVALSVGVQRMVRSDLGASGVMFTIDTETGFPDVVVINSTYGLGENVVQGVVNPDEFRVFKPTLRAGFKPIIHAAVGSKEMKLVYDEGGGRMVKNVPVPPAQRRAFSISDEQVLALARWGCLIEDHYSATRGTPTPMDIEWAIDGQTGEMFILQARPETVQSQRTHDQLEVYHLTKRGKVLASGRSVGSKVATGRARFIPDARQLSHFREGEVLVTDKTDPDWEPVMKKAAAIVTNRGGRTCHAAIVSRELGIPAVVGTEDATSKIEPGQQITVSCAEGEAGYVYAGEVPFELERIPLKDFVRPATKVMMNVANPKEALSLAMIPNDGVGLAREEFIIASLIKVHPMALAHFDQITDSALRAEIETITAGYFDKAQFFVDRLAQAAGMIAAAFYPKDVILRLSDFKTNEYANLVGGSLYEPAEENPMLGFRGASRYYNERYRDGFALECRAVKKIREDMGLTNLKIMVPFCRTPEEGRRVIEEMATHGLRRGQDGLEVYVMCEIPSNVILAEEFADIFDGFSIGSNDLTQLVLGVDRESEIVAPIFDERNPAVKKMIADVIGVCQRRKRKIGICGQAPSDYPEFVQFLIEQGIDSVSLNPDAVLKTTLEILSAERARKNRVIHERID